MKCELDFDVARRRAMQNYVAVSRILNLTDWCPLRDMTSALWGTPSIGIDPLGNAIVGSGENTIFEVNNSGTPRSIQLGIPTAPSTVSTLSRWTDRAMCGRQTISAAQLRNSLGLPRLLLRRSRLELRIIRWAFDLSERVRFGTANLSANSVILS